MRPAPGGGGVHPINPKNNPVQQKKPKNNTEQPKRFTESPIKMQKTTPLRTFSHTLTLGK